MRREHIAQNKVYAHRVGDTEELTLAKNVHMRRLAQGWMQWELAKKANLAISTICGVESGDHVCNERTLAQLARTFGCKTEELTAPHEIPYDPAYLAKDRGYAGHVRELLGVGVLEHLGIPVPRPATLTSVTGGKKRHAAPVVIKHTARKRAAA